MQGRFSAGGRNVRNRKPGEAFGPRYIINFPTKRHWKEASRMEYITTGLEALKAVLRERGIESVALPPLGCGNGGLDWADVRPVIETSLRELEGRVEVQAIRPHRCNT
ncbi:MAG: macro domain-containing protein [Hymenobacter sp.]